MAVQRFSDVSAQRLDIGNEGGGLVIEGCVGAELAQALVVLRGGNGDDIGGWEIDPSLLDGVHACAGCGGVDE